MKSFVMHNLFVKLICTKNCLFYFLLGQSLLENGRGGGGKAHGEHQ